MKNIEANQENRAENPEGRTLYGVPVQRVIEATNVMRGHMPKGDEPIEAASPSVYEFPPDSPWAGKQVRREYSDEIRATHVLPEGSDTYQEITPKTDLEGRGVGVPSLGYYSGEGLRVVKAEDGTIWVKAPGKWRYAQLKSLPTRQEFDRASTEVRKWDEEVMRRFEDGKRRTSITGIEQQYYSECEQRGLPIPYEVRLRMGEE